MIVFLFTSGMLHINVILPDLQHRPAYQKIAEDAVCKALMRRWRKQNLLELKRYATVCFISRQLIRRVMPTFLVYVKGITLRSYQEIKGNTAQFGCTAELYGFVLN